MEDGKLESAEFLAINIFISEHMLPRKKPLRLMTWLPLSTADLTPLPTSISAVTSNGFVLNRTLTLRLIRFQIRTTSSDSTSSTATSKRPTRQHRLTHSSSPGLQEVRRLRRRWGFCFSRRSSRKCWRGRRRPTIAPQRRWNLIHHGAASPTTYRSTLTARSTTVAI